MTALVRSVSRWTTMAAVTAVPFLSGCKTWEASSGSLTQVIAEGRPSSVRITDPDGRRLTVRNPVIRNDSIVTADTDPTGFASPARGIPYGEVNTVEIQRFSLVKTLAFVAVGTAASVTWAELAGDAIGGGGSGNEPVQKTGFTVSFARVAQLFFGGARR